MHTIKSDTIVGVDFCTLNLPDTIELLADLVSSVKIPQETSPKKRPQWFACVNPHSVETARRDPDFRAAVESSDLVTADGTGIVFGSILLGGKVRNRVCGPDIFCQLCAYLNERKTGTRMFFLGTNNQTLMALEKKFKLVYPHLVFAGGYAPPYRQRFSDEENAQMVDRINASNAEMLWVGLGAPKQEKWCHENAHKLNVNLIGPVGGVFDFFTGRVKLPPMWAQEMGMTWLWRLIQQPRRLFRRNLDTPLFLYHVLLQKLGYSE